MTMIMKNPHFKWEIGQESDFVSLSLKELLKHLEIGHLGWIFDPNCNLFDGKFKENELTAMAEFVRKAIEDLEKKDYDTWMTYFAPKL